MGKSVVRKDEIGFYIASGGYLARPVSETNVIEGEKYNSYHHGGSTSHSVTVGNIKENWTSFGGLGNVAMHHWIMKKWKESNTEKWNEYIKNLQFYIDYPLRKFGTSKQSYDKMGYSKIFNYFKELKNQYWEEGREKEREKLRKKEEEENKKNSLISIEISKTIL